MTTPIPLGALPPQKQLSTGMNSIEAMQTSNEVESGEHRNFFFLGGVWAKSQPQINLIWRIFSTGNAHKTLTALPPVLKFAPLKCVVHSERAWSSIGRCHYSRFNRLICLLYGIALVQVNLSTATSGWHLTRVEFMAKL